MSATPNSAQAPLPEVPDVYAHAPSRVAFAEAYGTRERIPFRSRLESRWARFFSYLGLPWRYEPYTFPLPNGRRYTPDFHVETPDGPLWVEIKPVTEALVAIELRLYQFARLVHETQPGARVVSLAMERPGWCVEPMGVLEWFGKPQAGVTAILPADARRLFAGETVRSLLDENPEHTADHLEREARRLMDDPDTPTLGEHLFTSAVTNGADFDAMRVAYFSHDPHSRFTFAQAWKPQPAEQ